MNGDAHNVTEQIRLMFANMAAGRHLALYQREHNGLLVWMAYLEYRRHKLPVPENILRWLDETADRLMRCGTDRADDAGEQMPVQIAKAVSMARKGGGSSSAKALATTEEHRNVVEAIVHWLKVQDSRNGAAAPKLADACRAVARDTGRTEQQVRSIYNDWMKGVPESAKPSSAAKARHLMKRGRASSSAKSKREDDTPAWRGVASASQDLAQALGYANATVKPRKTNRRA